MSVSNHLPNDNTVLDTLKEVAYFKMYKDDEEVIRKIASMCTRKSFNKGKAIINEGDYGDELFIMLNGEIDIIKKTLQDEEYTVTTLKAEFGGISVGELALIDNDKRSATVIAKTDCECLVINRNKFIKFGNDNPNLGLGITREIAKKISSTLRKTNADVITLFSALVEEIEENK